MLADSEKRPTLVEGTPDQHADAAAKAYKRARQGRLDRHWLFYVLVLLGAVGQPPAEVGPWSYSPGRVECLEPQDRFPLRFQRYFVFRM
jgi:hypothetical protein